MIVHSFENVNYTEGYISIDAKQNHQFLFSVRIQNIAGNHPPQLNPIRENGRFQHLKMQSGGESHAFTP
jgi:hypothetical protein